MTDTERRTDKVMRKARYLLRTNKISQTKQKFYSMSRVPKYKLQIININSGKVANDFS